MPFPRLRTIGRLLLGALALAFAVARPSIAEAGSPFLVVPEPGVAELSPAFRYANMTDAEAFAELDRRGLPYLKVDPVPGVRAPIRLTGRLRGVYFHSSLPPAQRISSIFEILDARLALALDDFAAILERHDIDEVVHFTMYRPNVAPPAEHRHDVESAPRQASAAGTSTRRRVRLPQSEKRSLGEKGSLDTKKPVRERVQGPRQGSPLRQGLKQKAPPSPPAKPTGTVTKERADTRKPPPKTTPAPTPAAKSPATPPNTAKPSLHKTSWAPPGTRHPAGLAIDVGLLRKKDGRWLNVAQHFNGQIGDKTCGDGAKVPPNLDARELRSVVCEAADLGVFTYVLTPNYNTAHVDHYHMEIKPGVRWFLYH